MFAGIPDAMIPDKMSMKKKTLVVVHTEPHALTLEVDSTVSYGHKHTSTHYVCLHGPYNPLLMILISQLEMSHVTTSN